MAFDETFRPHSNFDEVEVFGLTGQAKEIRELTPSHFEGPVAVWAEQRAKYQGETIIPRHVYVDRAEDPEGHRVAWVYHVGIDDETGASFCNHHVACDCYLRADFMDESEEREELLGSCAALRNVLAKRAQFINATYGITNIIQRMYIQDRPAFEQDVGTQHFVESTLLFMLEHDYRHPESWMANVESGFSLVSLAAAVLDLRREDTAWFVEDLAEKGMVESDGVVVQLSTHQRETIDFDKLQRSLAA